LNVPLLLARRAWRTLLTYVAFCDSAGITGLIKVIQIPRSFSSDPYDGVELVMWGAAEISITIMAASVPILRALLGERGRRRKERHRNAKVEDVLSGCPSKYRYSSSDNFELQSRNTCIIEAGPGGPRVGEVAADKKEEGVGAAILSNLKLPPSLLPATAADRLSGSSNPQGGIVRTSIVTVQFVEQGEPRPLEGPEAVRWPLQSPAGWPLGSPADPESGMRLAPFADSKEFV